MYFTDDMKTRFESKYGNRGERLECAAWDSKWATWLTGYAEAIAVSAATCRQLKHPDGWDSGRNDVLEEAATAIEMRSNA